jgi:hypothetical protein
MDVKQLEKNTGHSEEVKEMLLEKGHNFET